MFYENMPLYPGMKPTGCGDGCMRVKVFDDACGRDRPPAMRECERVTIENPCRPGEYAEVTLGVDDCGSLVICVNRRQAHCRRRRRPCDRPPRFEPCEPPEPCDRFEPCPRPRPCLPEPPRCRIPCRPMRGCGWR